MLHIKEMCAVITSTQYAFDYANSINLYAYESDMIRTITLLNKKRARFSFILYGNVAYHLHFKYVWLSGNTSILCVLLHSIFLSALVYNSTKLQ